MVTSVRSALTTAVPTLRETAEAAEGVLEETVVRGRGAFDLQSVSVAYGSETVIADVTMGIPSQAVTALIGPSGCGKSTLLRCLNRMNDEIGNVRVSGTIALDGVDIMARGVDPVELRMRVGQVFQRPNPFPMSIYDNVAYGPRTQGIRRRDELDAIVEDALRRAALWDEVKGSLKKHAFDLSGGQQQRLCIARALATKPEVLLMDEPASALDPISTQQIEDTIAELKRSVTIVIVTHNMQQAARVSDQTAFMLRERLDEPAHLIEVGETRKMFTNPDDPRTEAYITGRFG
ncbi:MAG: phosphate ABC transporter ATP-binding protein PstB [Anaerosomatales bacterium]|nr:phosphate ABC transporter ATP-binding protein [Coriobacteriia bacterium]MDI6692483.1 phosphate ABC transporter ATP-binding protein PstB [Anaerosomatales bacterium]MDI6843626.1 phosphate ABC transporter ATP-binding protein PstB [Anaerosomatales bacterium]